MTGPLTLHAPELPSASDARDLVVEGGSLEVDVPLRRGSATLRLRRMAGRWLATATGPEGALEVGADSSPYLAAGIALERWQPELVQVMLAVGPAVRRPAALRS
jgi:hypothetical protein